MNEWANEGGSGLGAVRRHRPGEAWRSAIRFPVMSRILWQAHALNAEGLPRPPGITGPTSAAVESGHALVSVSRAGEKLACDRVALDSALLTRRLIGQSAFGLLEGGVFLLRNLRLTRTPPICIRPGQM